MSVFTRYTLRSLAKNRTRTAVSVVGVALSVALITAVLTSVVSLSNLLLVRTAADEGWWYAEAAGITPQGLKHIERSDEVASWTSISELGSVSLGDDNSDLFGAYLYAKTWPAAQDVTEPLLSTPELVAGRAPTAPGEIVLPHYLQHAQLSACGISTPDDGPIDLGDQVTLELGTRTVTNLDDGSSYTATSYTGGYVIESTQQESYRADLGSITATVVGFYRSYGVSSTIALQGNSAYVYDDGSALQRAIGDDSDATWASIIMRTTDPAQAASFTKDLEDAGEASLGTGVHTSLIRWMGVTPDTAIWNTLYQIAGILAAIVVIAGISLVYNSFAISVAERTRQFGLLSSLGASRRQLRRTVITEALIIGAAGIPAGLALGLAGCFTVFTLLGEGIMAFTGGSDASVVISPVALALAAALGLITILVSAWIPAVRASRVSAVDAIRQTQDVRLNRAARRAQRRAARRAGKHGSAMQRSLGIAGKLFGIPGFIAHKNLTRSSSKGRVTVAALAVSVALIITSGSIADVMSYASDTAVNTMEGQDLALYIDATGAGADQTLALADGKVDGAGMQRSLARFYADASKVEGATPNGYATNYVADMVVPADMLDSDITGLDGSNGILSNGTWFGQAYVYFVDEATWEAYIADLGLSRDTFCDPEHPRAVAVNTYTTNDGETYATRQPFKATGSVDFLEFADLDGRFIAGIQDGPDGTPQAMYYDDHGEEHYLPYDEAVASERHVEVGALAEHAPTCVDRSGTLQLILPASAIALSANTGYVRAGLSFNTNGDAAQASKVEDALKKIAGDYPELDITYTNIAEAKLQARLMATTVNTFIYCFAIICGLIAVTNVFNTLANALMLRRREFAMLKSIGMGNRAFRRMIAYECASYALHGFAIGCVLALFASFGFYQAMMLSYSTYEFHLPLAQTGVALAIVLAVILVSVVYALRKSQGANIVESLRADAI